MDEKAEKSILEHLDSKGEIPDSGDFASAVGIDHSEIVNITKRLYGFKFVEAEEIKRDRWVLTDEGKLYAASGSPEVQLFSVVPPEGLSRDELQKKVDPSIFKIGTSYAAKNKWLEMGKQVSRKVEHVEDHVKDLLLMIKDGKVVGQDDINNLKRRKLIVLQTWSGYSLKKGTNFSLERKKLVTDFSKEHLQRGDWKKLELKEYNFKAKPLPPNGGHLHPLHKVKARVKSIFVEMGFEEMPTNNYVESSFWNFDALFQPQQHPARDSHDTFFLKAPSSTLELPEDYVERVKQVHESGGYGSKGYEYEWKREESEKNVLRTHTTAVSARMLYALAQKPFSPRRYYSIDRVFRNEAVDRTHLAEFHQIEGVVCDRGLTLADLMGVLNEFFTRLGMSDLRFKPTYNPYTEPSMEIYSYHQGFKKWVEVGNSGMFRPEMLRPMGLPEDVTAIAWGLSLESKTNKKGGGKQERVLKLELLMDIWFTTTTITTVVVGVVLLLLIVSLNQKKKKSKRNPMAQQLPPSVPGLPVIGNLLQLKDKKPHQTFVRWAEEYGPIYTIKTGASTMVVINSTPLVKEAMVTRFSSISTRKLSNALKILTSDKCMVATSDYSDFHKMAKRYIITGLLGANSQKQYRGNRDTLIENILHQLHTEIIENPLQPVTLRTIFEAELFALALKQALGKDLEEPIYVEELKTKMSKEEIYKVLVIDPMMGAIDVDWRDFFPYLKWVPNKRLETNIQRMYKRRRAVMKKLIGEQRKRISSGQKLTSYLDYLLTEAQELSEEELIMLIWETIIETSDTTLVTTEWAMYELAKNTSCQEQLYKEIQNVCGSDKITEEHLCKLPYLNAVFHETLRRHSPVPVIPLRYAHEDTELGGYHISAGSEIAINIYGCNMDKNEWVNPEEWRPERFLDGKYDQTDLYKTMAFGGGKRVCAGSLQAITISCMAIARFVQEFKWRLSPGQEDDVTTLALTSSKANPMQAILTPRDR